MIATLEKGKGKYDRKVRSEKRKQDMDGEAEGQKIKITLKIACRYLLFWIMKTTIDMFCPYLGPNIDQHIDLHSYVFLTEDNV